MIIYYIILLGVKKLNTFYSYLTAHSVSCERFFLFILFNRQTMAVGVWGSLQSLTYFFYKTEDLNTGDVVIFEHSGGIVGVD